MNAKKETANGSPPAHKDNSMSDTLSDYVTTRQAAELLGAAVTVPADDNSMRIAANYAWEASPKLVIA